MGDSYGATPDILGFSGNTGGGGMNPLLIASLAQAGGGLLSSIFGESYDQKLQAQEAAQEKLKSYSLGLANTLKPKQALYVNPYASQLGTSSMQAVMGNLAQRFGPELMAKWGIGSPTVTGTSSTPNTNGGGQPPVGSAAAQLLLKKYNLAGGMDIGGMASGGTGASAGGAA